MISIKSRFCHLSVGIALVLPAIAPQSAAIATQPFSFDTPTAQRYPLIPGLIHGHQRNLIDGGMGRWGGGGKEILDDSYFVSHRQVYLNPEPIIFSSEHELALPLILLKKEETDLLLASLFKGGSGNQTQLAQSNPPPPGKNPSGSSAGGRRDIGVCTQDVTPATTDPKLTALSPIAKPGNTLAERPTFLVFVPKTSATTGEFSLRDRNNRGVYRTTLPLTNTPGIVSVSLPAQAPALEIGQQYLWSFAVICNPNDRVDDRFVTGTVQRIALDSTRLHQIQQASPKEQVLLYQKADVWYDAIAVLFELQRSQPNDSTINTIWRELLHSGGVDVTINSK
ncbi:DUF928 domain-containing protein [Aerosakkonemataceae cyanobacterium BLCC-F50]|uniref:DUF928 domain-containing protein n=1 Tax=Floridaenema flaviceps BLCC-F50 TaxID=3153642 RepID=A0ABV4XW15_9CYAN